PLVALAKIDCVGDIDRELAVIERELKGYHTAWQHTSTPQAHIQTLHYSDAKGVVRLIEVSMTSAKEQRKDSYYFANQELFFATLTQNQPVKVQKLYFIHHQMVEWIDNGRAIDSKNKLFEQKSKEIQAFAQFLIQKD
ncbi:MAG: hypothetical protein IE878_03200, partial [Epsilonproteobacteria bacterium]|nr:hypothetical protein [Campylobacterota bacterium]